ncbi:MAG: hypothetical protein ACPGO5_04800 [Patescibacteria group bacterium]
MKKICFYAVVIAVHRAAHNLVVTPESGSGGDHNWFYVFIGSEAPVQLHDRVYCIVSNEDDKRSFRISTLSKSNHSKI